ncbi:MAG: amidohydrolase family protein [Ignavibacteriales bacterium]|nr:amidohydrolase family protein [Ignavibacteriales bacterium]
MNQPFLWTGLFVIAGFAMAQTKNEPQPIIDVHLHSVTLQTLKNDVRTPLPIPELKPSESVEQHIKQTLAVMDRYNVVLGLVSGYDYEIGEQFRQSAPNRVWSGPQFGRPRLNIDTLRMRYNAGLFSVMGELTMQYMGFSPSDPGLDPYFSLAESLNVPVSIHTGISFSGITRVAPNFRVSLGNPLLFEELLNRHPNLRVWLAHGGWPYLEETIGILLVYPQVYLDIAVIDWIIPREEFYAYLKALIRAGFGWRIMYGSDQMSWPETIGLGIEAINQADFLSAEQKRDILYNNAARFLRLTPEQIAKHHGKIAK